MIHDRGGVHDGRRRSGGGLSSDPRGCSVSDTPQDFEAAKKKALAIGATKCVVADIRREVSHVTDLLEAFS